MAGELRGDVRVVTPAGLASAGSRCSSRIDQPVQARSIAKGGGQS